MNNIVVIAPYTQHKFSSMKLHLWGKPRISIVVNALPFALNIVIKDLFFITCNDVLEKQVISLLWKKTCPYEQESFFFFLRVWGSQMTSLLTFPIFSKWWKIGDRDLLRFQVVLHGLHSTNSFKSIFIKVWSECLGLGSSLNNISTELNFDNQIETWQSVITPRRQNTRHSLSCFFSIFVILKLAWHYV